eukprot:COSAG02_NODE_11022_length_1810_cov_1.565167_2_plen_87_part_00
MSYDLSTGTRARVEGKGMGLLSWADDGGGMGLPTTMIFGAAGRLLSCSQCVCVVVSKAMMVVVVCPCLSVCWAPRAVWGRVRYTKG